MIHMDVRRLVHGLRMIWNQISDEVVGMFSTPGAIWCIKRKNSRGGYSATSDEEELSSHLSAFSVPVSCHF